MAKGRGLRSVMAGQNMVNGRPMHANKRLLTQILRNEWGVSHALVESDGGDVIGALFYGFKLAATHEDVAVMSLESGMDMDLGGTTFPLLTQAVRDGKTTEAQVDRAAYNILASKFASGIFDHPYTDETRVDQLDKPANRKMARDAAEQSMTLLINSKSKGAPLLPLDFSKIKKLALVGPLADDGPNQCGSYFNAGANVITVKAALEAGLKSYYTGVAMSYSYGASPDNTSTAMIPAAVAAAAAADVTVLVVGDTMTTCGEMQDRSSLEIAGAQLPLIEALAKPGMPPLVVLLINGRATTFGRGNTVLAQLEKNGALMVGWYI